MIAEQLARLTLRIPLSAEGTQGAGLPWGKIVGGLIVLFVVGTVIQAVREGIANRAMKLHPLPPGSWPLGVVPFAITTGTCECRRDKAVTFDVAGNLARCQNCQRVYDASQLLDGP